MIQSIYKWCTDTMHLHPALAVMLSVFIMRSIDIGIQFIFLFATFWVCISLTVFIGYCFVTFGIIYGLLGLIAASGIAYAYTHLLLIPAYESLQQFINKESRS